MLSKLSKSLKVIVLWAFIETVGGGILHGLKFPFTGWFLTAASMWCLHLLVDFLDNRKQLSNAVLSILLAKFFLAPTTPFTAFFAVIFQGLLFFLAFNLLKKNNKVLSFLLILTCFYESAFQKIIVLTFFFGTDFWKAIDEFLLKLNLIFHTKNEAIAWILTIYILIYTIGAVLTFLLLQKIKIWILEKNDLPLLDLENTIFNKVKTKKYWFFIGFLVLVTLFFTFHILGNEEIIMLLLRFLTLYFIVFYLQKYFFAKILGSKFQYLKENSTFQTLLNELPELNKIVFSAWHHAKSATYFKRYFLFIKYLFQFSLR